MICRYALCMNEYFEKYNIIIIYNTYDIYDKDAKVRKYLSDTWSMKLRGYQKYFPYGVLPIDQYDFLCHHILIQDRKTKKILLGCKSITQSNCDLYGYPMPIKEHLIGENRLRYNEHSQAIDQWIASCARRGQDFGYSCGFTIEPSLEKAEKLFLTNMFYYLFYYFYNSYEIGNIIQGISVRFKLDQAQSDIGFEYLKYQQRELPIIRTKSYDNVESYIMTLSNYAFKAEHIEKALRIEKLWDEREEFIGKQKLVENKQVS